ncbi:MAG: DUF2284 domain-containing protein [Candidatus Helarchaeota archaeon]
MLQEKLLDFEECKIPIDKVFFQRLSNLLEELEINFIKSIDTNQLIIDERAPYACQFGCRNYNTHYSCPPHSFSPQIFREKLRKWDKVILFTISKTLEEFWNEERHREIEKFSFYHKKIVSRLTENRMHKILIKVEEFFKEWGLSVFGLAGGSCHSCKICGLKEGKSCKKPEKMRMSLESVGIDVERSFSLNGYDIAMPNFGSSIRAAGLLVKGNLSDINITRKKSPQKYIPEKKIDLNLILDEKKIEKIEFIDIDDIIIRKSAICNENCQHYNRNYSCPPYVNRINLNLWSKGILWKWKKNSFKIHSYSRTIEYIHKKIFHLGHYFALPLRHCRCDFCSTCSFQEKGNNKYVIPEPCKRYKVLAPAMEALNIDMKQFGDGIFGIELI